MRLVRYGRWGGWLAVLALAGCHRSQEKGGPQQAAANANKPLPVEVVELQPGPVRDVGEYIGTLISRRSITVYPQVAGYIQRIMAKPGQRVRAGDPLLEVDPRREQAGVQSAQAQRRSALAQRQYATSTRQRAEELLREGLMSRQDYEQAVAQATAAEASARSAEAQLQAQQVQLGYYRVTAPFAGVVGDIPVKVGDYVTPQTVLTNVDQSRALEVSVFVPPERASEVEVGKTQVQVLDDEDKPVVSAPAFFVAPTPNPTTQLVEVKAGFDNPAHLRSGQVVHVRVIYDVHDALRLPTFAVTQLGSQAFATVAQPSDGGTVAQRQPVKLGPIDGNAYELLGGLDAGTQVIIGSLQQLRDGQPIQPKPVQPPPGGEEQGVGGSADAGMGGPLDGGR